MKKPFLILILSVVLSTPAFGFNKQTLAVIRLKSKTSGVNTDTLTKLLQAKFVKKKNNFIIVVRNGNAVGVNSFSLTLRLFR